jgi:repressor LexA
MHNHYQTKLFGFYDSNKRMPSYSEMMELFGFKSKNAVFRIVEKLIDAGVIIKDAAGKIIPAIDFNEIPLLGSVKAGFPAATEDVLDDTLNLNDFLLPRKDKMYLVAVDGDSMIDAHIADGDIVIAERYETAHDGDIVIANIDGEFTMKYFKTSKGKIWLEPANKDFSAMYPEYHLTIVAKITGVVRKY